MQNTLSLVLPNGAADLEQFIALLERLVQCNFSIIADRTLELIVQIVRQPLGGGGQRRKLDSLMRSEIINNKRAYLINVHNPGTSVLLCAKRPLLCYYQHHSVFRSAICVSIMSYRLYTKGGGTLCLDETCPMQPLKPLQAVANFRSFLLKIAQHFSALLLMPGI
jgi:hypothetical protein